MSSTLLERVRGAVRGDEPDEGDDDEFSTEDTAPDVESLSSEPQLEADPPPKRAKTKTVRRPVARVTVAQKRSVEDAIFMLIVIPSSAIALRDPVCANAFKEQAREIAKACVPLICRNPAWLTALTGSSIVFELMALGEALAPAVGAVYGHHFSKNRGDSDESGPGPADYAQYPVPRY